ncbi:hypothetical protein [Pseudoneobacillus sp. C159]
MGNKRNKEITNVEFGIEFGDLNNAKLYELAFSNQSDKQRENNKKKQKK